MAGRGWGTVQWGTTLRSGGGGGGGGGGTVGHHTKKGGGINTHGNKDQ